MQSNTYSPKDATHSQPLKINTINQTIGIAYIGNRFLNEIISEGDSWDYPVTTYTNMEAFNATLANSSISDMPHAILMEVQSENEILDQVRQLRANPITAGIIIILLSASTETDLQEIVLDTKANDIYFRPFDSNLILERIIFLIPYSCS